jgi:hypothetical protein
VSAVVVVFFVWFALVVAAGLLLIALAPRLQLPQWACAARERFTLAADGAGRVTGRPSVAVTVLLAGWGAIVLICWGLGVLAHKLEHAIDRPQFDWWQRHHLGGTWSRVWWDLTNIGSPNVTQGITIAGAALMAVLYWGTRNWWAPSLTLLLGYLAEDSSQVILKLTVHRGHPPTTLGTWPSGGMGRLELVYGLVLYFLVKRFWPHSKRMWATAAALLALAASIQAFARINNLEHWMTDVIGGAIYGLLLLLLMITAHAALTRAVSTAPARTATAEPALT